MRILIIACMSILIVNHVSSGVNRIVAKSGADFTTINAGLSAANGGDTVLVKAGTYTEIVKWPKSGAASGYIVLKAFGDGPAIISGGTATQENEALVVISSKSYAAIIGMEIGPYTTASDNIFIKGIQVEGTSQHILIKKCKIHHITTTSPSDNAGANAIGVFGRSASLPITDCVIDSCEIYNNMTGYSEAISIDGNVDGFTISHCHIHDNNNIGILIAGFYGECENCGAADQARHGVICDNIVERCSSCDNPAYKGDCSAGGIYSDGGGKSIIERNCISRCDIGIEAGAELAGAVDDSMIIRDNLIYNCNIGGLFIGGYETNRGVTVYCQVINNTFYQNDSKKSGCGEFLIQKAHGNLIKNNIFYTNSQKQAITTAFNSTSSYNNMIDNNLFCSTNGSTGIEGASLDAHAKSGDPKFVNAQTGNFHLLSGSAAIDACDIAYTPASFERDLDGNARKTGSAVDIGAFEFSATSLVRKNKHTRINASEVAKNKMVIHPIQGEIYVKIRSGDAISNFDINGQILKSRRHVRDK
ncbi:MAG: DUF5123 domain-containing protein [Fibrobacter sp.]|nr:DUF5123 domain-containing protein [Fibrobacter sp.]